MKTIQTSNAPTPKGHYSQAAIHGGLCYVSGILPVQAGKSPDPDMSFDDQANIVLDTFDAILRASKSRRDKVVNVTIYISDIELWPQFNELYTSFFGEHRPARAVVPVPELHYGFALELTAIAAV